MSLGDPKLDALFSQALKLREQVTPSKRAEMDRDSAISFVYGNLKLSGSRATREQVAAAYDARRRHDWDST